jgi:hypothetical protein
MPRWSRPLILLVASLTLIGAATPPAIEEHLEPGFCSAECAVQHDGHGAAVTPPPPSSAASLAMVAKSGACRTAAELVVVATPDAPRAPPSA